MSEPTDTEIRIGFDSLSATAEIFSFLQISDQSSFVHEYKSFLPDNYVFITARLGDQLIGTQAFMPYVLKVNGEKHLAARSERTRVSQQHRSYKLFPKLMAACEKEGTKRGLELVWGFTTAVKPFQRVGYIFKHNFFQNYVLCLKPIKLVGDILKTNTSNRKFLFATILSSPLSILFQALQAIRPRRSSITVQNECKDYDEIEKLYDRIRGDQPLVHIDHTMQFYRWFFQENQQKKFRSYYAYFNHELVAYIHIDISHPFRAYVADFCSENSSATLEIIRVVKKELTSTQHRVLVFQFNKRNPQLNVMSKSFLLAGFFPLNKTGNLCLKPLEYQDMNVINDIRPWYITRIWEPLL